MGQGILAPVRTGCDRLRDPRSDGSGKRVGICQDRANIIFMNEQPEKEQSVFFDEVQGFFNDPALDLPEMRRDLSDPQNARWLIRNFSIRNKDAVPVEYWNM